MLMATLQRLFRHEAASGIVLMVASALALVLANSPMGGFYDLLLSLRGSVRIGSFGIEKPLLLWVNDGLMAIFFLLVGLEIKREVLAGQLSDRSGAILPAAAAIGGSASASARPDVRAAKHCDGPAGAAGPDGAAVPDGCVGSGASTGSGRGRGSGTVAAATRSRPQASQTRTPNMIKRMGCDSPNVKPALTGGNLLP